MNEEELKTKLYPILKKLAGDAVEYVKGICISIKFLWPMISFLCAV